MAGSRTYVARGYVTVDCKGMCMEEEVVETMRLVKMHDSSTTI